MPATVRIRRMRPGDEPQAEALWKGMSPYRPGDESAVEAMYARADRARATGDKRWKGLDAPATDEVVQDLSASWVAAVPSDRGEDRVVGTVQVVGPTALSQMPLDLPLSRAWCLREHVAELRRLRVAQDMWRRGLGTRLTRAVIDWCRVHRFSTLVLNTTTPQKPAIDLYRKLGFREAGCTFLDKYELVWMRLKIW